MKEEGRKGGEKERGSVKGARGEGYDTTIL